MSPEAAKRPPETPNEAAQATLISQIAAHWKKFRLGNELIFSWLKMQRLDQRFLRHTSKVPSIPESVHCPKGASLLRFKRDVKPVTDGIVPLNSLASQFAS